MTPLKVLAVHGIRCHARAKDIPGFAQVWHDTLQPQLAQPISVKMAYWYNSLEIPPAMGTNVGNNLTTQEQALAEQLLADFGGPPEGAQGPAGAIVNTLLGAILRHTNADRHYDLSFLQRLLREISRYFHPDHPDKRSAAKHVITDAIAQHKPDVVIAHSFGTVITHEALWTETLTQTPMPTIPLLITIGSPLAMPNAIISQLNPRHLSRPPMVTTWVNLRESGDYVTCAGPLSDHYQGITADETITIPGSFMPHEATHYLKHPRVADHIKEHSSQ